MAESYGKLWKPYAEAINAFWFGVQNLVAQCVNKSVHMLAQK